MVLLSKSEYDALVARAGSVEAQVEQRLEFEKSEILRKLNKGLTSRLSDYRSNPLQTLQELVNELLR